jgi:hypothetical protein
LGIRNLHAPTWGGILASQLSIFIFHI